MFTRIGRAITRQPLWFVLAWAVVLCLFGSFAFNGWGHGDLFDRLSSSESSIPGTQSQQVSDLTTGNPDAAKTVTLVFTGVDLAQDAEPLAGLVAAHRADFKVEDVATVSDAFSQPDLNSPQAKALLSSAGDGFVMVATLDKGLDDDQITSANDSLGTALNRFLADLRPTFPQISGHQVSTETIADAISNQTRQDLVRGEIIGLPVALVLLVLVFGGLLAAGLPLVSALISIGIGLGVLWVLTFVIDIDSFILNVISIIGLALSIDYGLLVVSRYREEITGALAREKSEHPRGILDAERMRELVHQAVVRTVATSGRTVTFSALTIACSIAGLLVMTSSILKTIAIGGVVVTVLAVMSAVTLVPAIITLLGVHLVRPSSITRVPVLGRVLRVVGDSSSDSGFFSKLAHKVVARPWVIIVVVVAMLGLMASPIATLKLRTAFAEYIPAQSSAGIGYDTLQRDYPALAAPDITVVADTAPADTGQFVAHIKGIDHVDTVSVQPVAGHQQMSQISISSDSSDPVGPQVTAAVKELRGYPAGYQFWVGGPAATQLDFNHSLFQGAPAAIAIVVGAVLVLLFLMTGSIIVPIKTLLINTFSLVASLGATWWLFESGRLGLPRQAGLESFIVACMLAFGFGLAMDYEVFLLARVKEYWDIGYNNDEAVARGLQRSGRIITSAAAIIIAVFLGFVAGELIAIKQIGVALAITVATDATLIRMLLVPSTMTVLGKWNWWAPKPLRAVHKKFGLHD